MLLSNWELVCFLKAKEIIHYYENIVILLRCIKLNKLLKIVLVLNMGELGD